MADPRPRRIRIGIDTGGTFTDVVAFDEDTGELVTTKTPSTPANPADGFMTGVAQGARPARAPTGDDVTAVSHGTTVATNQLLEGKVERLGFITTEGYEFDARDRPAVGARRLRQLLLLGQAAADRARPTWSRTVGGRLDFTGARGPAVRRGRRRRGRPLVPRPGHHHDRRLLPALLRQPRRTSCGCATVLRREHPDAVVSISSEVLREYREYERVDDHAGRRRGEAAASRRYVAQHPRAGSTSFAGEPPRSRST